MKTIVMLVVCLGLLAAPTTLISLNHPGAGLVGIGMACGVMLGLPVIAALWVLYTQAYWTNHDRSSVARAERGRVLHE